MLSITRWPRFSHLPFSGFHFVVQASAPVTAVMEGLHSFASTALFLAVLLFLGSLVRTVIYNLSRHPLAHCPGPRLAGATYLYQTYFCFVGGSRYYKQIAKLHEIYGLLDNPHPQPPLPGLDDQKLISNTNPPSSQAR